MIIWVLLGAVLAGAMAMVAWRLAAQPSLTRVSRSLLGLMSGAMGGTACGVALGTILGQFVGFQPGETYNWGVLAAAFGLLGVVIGGLAGLRALQQGPAGSP